MVDKVFDELLMKGIRQGKIPARQKDAREWFRNKAKAIQKPSKSKLIRNAKRDRKSGAISLGDMYFFRYSAKHAGTLPYWDKIPLIFPFDDEGDKFKGLNLHYLPPKLRAQLMDALYDLRNNNEYNDSTRLMLSYDVLRSASKYRFFRPCVHRYIKNNVQTSFVYVSPVEWDIALFLPLARWQGASAEKVYAESRKQIKAR